MRPARQGHHMSLYVIKNHLVVLLETRESREAREENPRKRARYVISCTCSQKRKEDNHCIHTRAFLESEIRPEKWRYIHAEPMKAPDRPEDSHNVGRKAAA